MEFELGDALYPYTGFPKPGFKEIVPVLDQHRALHPARIAQANRQLDQLSLGASAPQAVDQQRYAHRFRLTPTNPGARALAPIREQIQGA